MMRALSYILIVPGIYLLVLAGYQEFRGNTNRPESNMPFSSRSILENSHSHHTYQFAIRVLKKNNPTLFRKYMIDHCLWSFWIEVAGIVHCATVILLPEKQTVV